MAINIKNPETEELARLLSEATGESLTARVGPPHRRHRPCGCARRGRTNRRGGLGRAPRPTRLSRGDCLAYAKDLGQPLRFKGNNFSRTDVEVAAY
jgi:uncharacterized protein with PIN domain